MLPRGGARARARRLPRYTPLRGQHAPRGIEGDVEAMAMYAGQGVGSIEAVEPAAAIIERYAAALRSE